TKDAAQIAPAEKDRTRPVPAAETIFLAKMRKRAGHARQASAFAHAYFVVESIDLTIARTNLTLSQRLNRLDRALLKNALLERSHVRRNKRSAEQNQSPAAAQLHGGRIRPE